MYSLQVRPMNAAERKISEDALAREYNEVPGNHLMWALGWLVLAMVCLGTSMSQGSSFIYTLAALACCIGVWSRFYQHRTQQSFRKRRQEVYLPQLRESLENGEVIVERIEPTEAVEVFQDEDNRYFLFAVAPDQVLYFSNILTPTQHNLSDADYARWPNTAFEIVRSANDNSLIGWFCHGDKLEAVQRRNLTECPLDTFFMGIHEAVLAGTPQSIADQISEH